MLYQDYMTLLEEYRQWDLSQEDWIRHVAASPSIPMKTGKALIRAANILADAAEKNIRGIVEDAGIKMIDFARKFNIPYRTVQDWLAGLRHPPLYVPALIGYVLLSECQESEHT